MALVLVAFAAMGCHAGIGPVFSYAPGHGGFGLGVETSGGVGPLGAAAGGVVRPWAEQTRETQAVYVAGELGLAAPLDKDYRTLIGGGTTVGAAVDGGRRVVLIYGVWGSGVQNVNRAGVCNNAELDQDVSVSAGVRWFGDKLELFVAPKINAVVACPFPD